MAVVDPLLSGKPRTHEIERLRLLFPSLPLLAYTELARSTAGILLHLGRVGIQQAIFQRYDDAPEALREAIQTELDRSAVQDVMRALDGRLRELPYPIGEAIAAMLHDCQTPATATELAKRAHLTRRTCERWFLKLRLPSPRVVLTLVRLLYAHRLLQDPGYTVDDVALRLGYGKTHTLQVHVRAVFGMTAGELRLALSGEEAVSRVSRRYFGELHRVAS
jgi:AraC-like DNA-binding protein